MLFTVDVDLTQKIVQIPIDELWISKHLFGQHSINQSRMEWEWETKNFQPIELNFTMQMSQKHNAHNNRSNRIGSIAFRINIIYVCSFCWLFIVDLLLLFVPSSLNTFYELTEKYKIQPEREWERLSKMKPIEIESKFKLLRFLLLSLCLIVCK